MSSNRFSNHENNVNQNTNRSNNTNGMFSRESRANQANQPRPFNPIPYTKDEYENIKSLLDKVLGPEYVSFRPGGGGQSVSYIEGWKALNLANEIFGFNGWSSELINSQVDYFDTHGNSGRYSMGLSVVVRITIKDGTYHEDFGYGYIDNAKSKAMAFEKCRKEAFTDGLKRCLRCFGNVLGNCLYDRSIISKIQKVKLPPVEYESDNFHRDPLLVKREQQKKQITSVNLLEKENTENKQQINCISHQNEMQTNNASINLKTPQTNNDFAIPNSTTSLNMPPKQNISTPQPRVKIGNSTVRPSIKYTPSVNDVDMMGDFDDSFVFSDDIQMENDVATDGLDDYQLQMFMEEEGRKSPINESKSQAPTKSKVNEKLSLSTNNEDNAKSINSGKEGNINDNNAMSSAPALFVSAKKATVLQQTPEAASKMPQFDAKFITPNIRRTLDPSKSVPVKRSEVQIVRKSVSDNGTLKSPKLANKSPGINKPTTPVSLGKRLVGLPPSQRPPIRRLHKEISQEPNSVISDSPKDKENQLLHTSV